MCRCCHGGHLECLKYLHEEAKRLGIRGLPYWAARNGHLHILEYLVERKYDKYDEDACKYAAMFGHLDCLKYLHETAKAPWNSLAVRYAHENNQPRVFTIPSRQQLSSPTRLAIRARRVIHSRTRIRRIRVIYTTSTNTHTQLKETKIFPHNKSDSFLCFKMTTLSPSLSPPFASHATKRIVTLRILLREEGVLF